MSTATSVIDTYAHHLSLHDALPFYRTANGPVARCWRIVIMDSAVTTGRTITTLRPDFLTRSAMTGLRSRQHHVMRRITNGSKAPGGRGRLLVRRRQFIPAL